jgi:hypothetical protein
MYDGEGALSDDVEQLVAGLAAGGGRKAALHYEHTPRPSFTARKRTSRERFFLHKSTLTTNY